MKLLKLTSHNDNKPIVINAKKIIYMYESRHNKEFMFTRILLSGYSSEVKVIDRLEDIVEKINNE